MYLIPVRVFLPNMPYKLKKVIIVVIGQFINVIISNRSHDFKSSKILTLHKNQWTPCQARNCVTNHLITKHPTTSFPPFTLHFSLFTAHRILFTVHFSLFTVHCSPFTFHFSLFTVHHLLFTLHSHSPLSHPHSPILTLPSSLS